MQQYEYFSTICGPKHIVLDTHIKFMYNVSTICDLDCFYSSCFGQIGLIISGTIIDEITLCFLRIIFLKTFLSYPHSRSKCNRGGSDLKRCFVAQTLSGPVVDQ